MTDNIDMFDEAPEPGDLRGLIHLARRAVALERETREAEERFKALNGRLNELKTKEIPDMMASAGMLSGELKLDDGTSIKVEDFVTGSLATLEEGKKEAAFNELARIGGADIIKNTLTLDFNKSEHNRALDLAERLRAEGFEPKLGPSVHPQTLFAFIREKLRGGEPVDPEKLGCFVGRKAKIKLGGEK